MIQCRIMEISRKLTFPSRAKCKKGGTAADTYGSDFFSSPLPSVHQDEKIDVVICDFALDDFRKLHHAPHTVKSKLK